jgi:hypothetical protein
MRFLAFACLIIVSGLFPSFARAGVFEVGAQANYRKTNFDATHSEEMETGTGSIAYYFWDLSALEFSYTRGAEKEIQPEYTAYQDLSAYGVDVMFTLANRDSIFKPYVKVGAAWIDKNLRYYITGFSPYGTETSGIAPTGGVGFKFMLTQQFAIKFGVDVSSSPLFFYTKTVSPPPSTPVPADPVTYDFSANAGLSFLF